MRKTFIMAFLVLSCFLLLPVTAEEKDNSLSSAVTMSDKENQSVLKNFFQNDLNNFYFEKFSMDEKEKDYSKDYNYFKDQVDITEIQARLTLEKLDSLIRSKTEELEEYKNQRKKIQLYLKLFSDKNNNDHYFKKMKVLDRLRLFGFDCPENNPFIEDIVK